jgi:hypothetical protein
MTAKGERPQGGEGRAGGSGDITGTLLTANGCQGVQAYPGYDVLRNRINTGEMHILTNQCKCIQDGSKALSRR